MGARRKCQKREQRPRGRTVRARYDAAQTTSENRRHWAAADSLSPNAAASPAARKIVRERARYEVANNTYARGIISTLANDVIGTGPRLQMLLEPDEGEDNSRANAANQFIEREYARWCEAIGLAEKLRTMQTAKPVDGESLALLATNPALGTPVKLDVQPFEADFLVAPWPIPDTGGELDGIRYDAAGNPSEYHVLRSHPGDTGFATQAEFGRGDWVPASAVLHHFRVDRPGQRRGVSEIMPALPLFSQMRRYTLAVIGAAETAADFAGVIHTTAPAGSAEAEAAADLPELEITQRMLVPLPNEWDLTQVKAEQPATTYGDFKAEIIAEIARCLDMPYNIAAGSSKGHTYSSGKLDHRTYYKSIRVRQRHVAVDVLDRILSAWLGEARLIPGYLPDELRYADAVVPHRYFWDEPEDIEPAKSAVRQKIELGNRTTTKAAEGARKGADWEDTERQLDREERLDTELKLRRQAWERDLRKKLKLGGGEPPGQPGDVSPKAPDENGGDE